MAVPKRKVSKARRDKRRSTWKLSLPGMTKCPKCGKPKREGDCGCSAKEIDPRLAVLKNFFSEEEN